MIRKIKFVEPGEKVKISQKGIKYFGEDIKNQEFTVKKVVHTYFDGIIIYQIVELDESPLKAFTTKTIATGWLDLPWELVSLEEVKEKMPELIKELDKVNKEVEEVSERLRKKRMNEKKTNNHSPFFRVHNNL